MDMTQALNAQLAVMMFLALMPMLGMMQAGRLGAPSAAKSKFPCPRTRDRTGSAAL